MSSTGPTPQTPATVAALSQRLAAVERTIRRLQINRTPQSLSVGKLSNVQSRMDGSGVSSGQTLVYDKLTGTYKPGAVSGTAYPTLTYTNRYHFDAPVLLNDGPFLVEQIPVNRDPFPDPNVTWGVVNGPALSQSGTFWDQARVAQMNRASSFSMFSGPDFNEIVATTPWVAQGGTFSPAWAWANLTTAPSHPMATFNVVTTLPTIRTPEGPDGSAGASYFIQIRCGNTTRTEWISIRANLTIRPEDIRQTQISDFTIETQVGSSISLALLSGGDPLPCIKSTETTGIYVAHMRCGIAVPGPEG